MKHRLGFIRNFVAMNTYSPSIYRIVRIIPRACFFLTILFSTLLLGRIGNAQQSATLNCDSTDTINVGQVLKGDTLRIPVALINNFSKTDTTWTISAGLSYFGISGSSNGGAGFGNSWLTNVVLNADTLEIGPVTATITITPSDSSCTGVQLLLEGDVIGPTADDSTFSLQNASTEVIAIQSNTNSTSRLFYFKNESTALDTIDSVYITGTTAFSIDSPHTFPIILNAQSSLPVSLTYQRSSQGSDNGDLFIVSVPNEPILFDFALQGVRTANDAVQTQPPTTIYFYLYPNPSNGPVTIHTENILQSHVTITDVLGRTLTEASFTGDWQWDRSRGNGIAPSGTYFVVVTGIGMGGEPVHEVKRLVIE